jgi:hypothetical protein
MYRRGQVSIHGQGKFWRTPEARARDARSVAEEITTTTRIGPRYLEALENEEWGNFRGVFNRGLCAPLPLFGSRRRKPAFQYDLAYGEQNHQLRPYENKIPRTPIWVPILAVLGLLAVLGALIAGGIYGWRRYAAHRAAKRSSALLLLPAQTPLGNAMQAPSAIAITASNSANSSPTVPLDLSVSTSAATRLRILADGALLLDAELPAEEPGTIPPASSLK